MYLSNYYSHTDLALEIEEELGKAPGKKEGYEVETSHYHQGQIKEQEIRILSSQAARMFGKPQGTYISLEGVNLSDNDGGFHSCMSSRIAAALKKLAGPARRLLLVGLGNRNITADALGPMVVDHLLITRPSYMNHAPDLISPCKPEYGKMSSFPSDSDENPVRISYAIAPGVLAQTGMETLEIIRGIISQTFPEKVIVVDALAAGSLERLYGTVQISSNGISPGSGVGNHRQTLCEDSLGIPVIAIGVPTVISIPALTEDLMEALKGHLSRPARQELDRLFHPDEKEDKLTSGFYRRLSSLIDRRLFDFIMTPKDADESIRRISYTISEGINQLIAGSTLYKE